jgi:hypothetical protein
MKERHRNLKALEMHRRSRARENLRSPNAQGTIVLNSRFLLKNITSRNKNLRVGQDVKLRAYRYMYTMNNVK